ncbi:hypothetical protein ACG98H_13125 [Corynebacterium sp. L4756]|uniref:hypothetical protein n=1 Tax=unclassified Corynebacterium TaxID=2624378 RepID=UPI00374DD02E
MDIGVSHDASMMRRPPHIICRRGCIFSSTAAEICSVHAAVFAAPTAPSSAYFTSTRDYAGQNRA